MIELNKIAFIDEDGFDFNDGESLIRFDTVAYYPDRNEIIYAITNNGKISVITYDVFEDDKGHYIEYGNTLIKIYISEDWQWETSVLLSDLGDLTTNATKER